TYLEQPRSISTGLLITALFAVVSGLTKQFYYVDKQLTWQGAQQYCREKYIDLAFITDQEEAELFSTVLTSEFNWIGLTWIGLYRDTNDSTEWKWSGGWNSTFRFWSKGLPNHLIVNQDCVGVIKGEMADSLCAERLLGVVGAESGTERLLGVVGAESGAERLLGRKSISTGLLITALFAVVSGLTKQFYYVDKQLTWQGAQQYCREKYIDLAFITDQEEAELFSTVLTSEFNWIGLTWIGLYRDTNDSTEWKWSGGWNSTFRFWSKGLPNHLIVNQDCVGVIKGEMADSLCKQINPFWCFDKRKPKYLFSWVFLTKKMCCVYCC
uniref:C-type lectin domain-containing protein n=1 Tax=Oncorhynchus tshawytscha TaxID=74940 RepID=A0AAZ3RFF9_ONCTS